MRILVLADIHGAVDELDGILSREPDADLIVVAGGITDPTATDAVATAEEVIGLLADRSGFVKVVPGNMDPEDVLRMLVKQRMNLHKDIFSLGGFDFVGFGAHRDEDESKRANVVEQLLNRTTADHRAVVCHKPPKNTAVDRASSGGQRGDPELRALLEDVPVDLVICGHVHEAQGTDRIGDTLIVNPGAVKDGHYAVIEAVDGDIDVDCR